jgi:hypothetical protein
MKIFWFNWRCWLNPSLGGAEAFTREISKRWVVAGNDVTLFTAEFLWFQERRSCPRAYRFLHCLNSLESLNVHNIKFLREMMG